MYTNNGTTLTIGAEYHRRHGRQPKLHKSKEGGYSLSMTQASVSSASARTRKHSLLPVIVAQCSAVRPFASRALT